MGVACDVLSPLWRVFGHFLHEQKVTARRGVSDTVSVDEGLSVGESFKTPGPAGPALF